jgi:hypothetical protein
VKIVPKSVFCAFVSHISHFGEVGFEVLTAASTKMPVFWVIALCSLVEIYRLFRGTCCVIALMMESASISETSVNFYQTTRRYNPDDSHLCTFLCLFRLLALQMCWRSCRECKGLIQLHANYKRTPHLHLSEQVSLSPDLCDQPTNQPEARLFRQYFLQKRVHKIVTNGFLSFYRLCWLGQKYF